MPKGLPAYRAAFMLARRMLPPPAGVVLPFVWARRQAFSKAAAQMRIC
jgi:hypothetical protein